MPASYATSGKNDPISTISNLKSTIKEAVAETAPNALNISQQAGNQSLQDAVLANKNIVSNAGNESTVQAVTKAAALSQMQNQQNQQNQVNAQFQPPADNKGYTVSLGKTVTQNLPAFGAEQVAAQRNQANSLVQNQLNQMNSERNLSLQNTNTLQQNAQSSASAQKLAAIQAQAQKDVAATQAGAAIASAQYGALGSILAGSGSGGSRHQYW